MFYEKTKSNFEEVIAYIEESAFGSKRSSTFRSLQNSQWLGSRHKKHKTSSQDIYRAIKRFGFGSLPKLKETFSVLKRANLIQELYHFPSIIRYNHMNI